MPAAACAHELPVASWGALHCAKSWSCTCRKFSNYGLTTVDISAPGVQVWNLELGGNYSFRTGTSMAAPHASGCAALLLAQCVLLLQMSSFGIPADRFQLDVPEIVLACS